MCSNGPWARIFGERGEGMRKTVKENDTELNSQITAFHWRSQSVEEPQQYRLQLPVHTWWGKCAVPLRNNLVVVWQQVGHLKNEDQILDHSIKPQNISLTATPAPAQIVTVHLGSHPKSRPPTSFFNLIQICIRQLEGCLSNRSSWGFWWRSGRRVMRLVRRLGGH